ncbi:MAG: DUF4367 domain-containing protein [Firmicutes bacterium]|nr:DUF4367 domain-containing protein [Bacillota bacterium]MBR6584840.1 DUF4367 domain-containing protein [Bacillota bacterium]
MDSNLKLALGDALTREYAWIDEINPAELDYQFSPEFEVKMQKLIEELSNNERKYVHVGHHRIKRALLIAIVAVMLLGLVACAVVLTKPTIVWNETQNDASGTLDITFDIQYPEDTEIPTEFEPVKPKRPWGYRIDSTEMLSSSTFRIHYKNSKGKEIIYTQEGNISSMHIGIDNEEALFTEIMINGHKGFSSSKLGNNALTWSDGIYLYDIIGTCDMETIEKMARSIP